MIVGGVGGQGILAVATIIAASALKEGLFIKQAEEHGMAQRGGAVVTHLRLSDSGIYSDLVPQGAAQIVVSMEPMEALRYLDYLSEDGVLLTAVDPVTNIPNYPEPEQLLQTLSKVSGVRLIEAARLARTAGSARATNMVMVGAASAYLPILPARIEAEIRIMFARKGDEVVATNIDAFRLGRYAATSPAVTAARSAG
jgi:indolepyruvate ferredoxin oxidoreductase beta subunit